VREEDERVYRKHAEELTRFATFLVGPHDAADVVSEAVLHSFTTAGWDTVSERRAYLFRAVLNHARMLRRSERRRRTREQRALPADLMRDVEEAADALALVARLSPRQRAVIYLAYWEDLDPSSIAELLGISEGSVRRHLARGREALRRMLDDG
jgi:RNA polymerase sigma factor (sigma-70 family)